MKIIISIGYLFLIVIAVYWIQRKLREEWTFHRQGLNTPHIRFCKFCGQKQEEFVTDYYGFYGNWELVDEVIDPKCKCHKFL